MNVYKRGIKQIRRLSKSKILKLKKIQTYSIIFMSGEYLCGYPCGNLTEPGCPVCCLHCPKLSLCYESWLNGYERICLGRSNRAKAWCSCARDYLNEELKKEI